MHARLVRYEDVSPDNWEIGRNWFTEDYLPVAMQTDGFSGAYLLHDDERMCTVSVTLWTDAETEAASGEAVQHHLDAWEQMTGIKATVETTKWSSPSSRPGLFSGSGRRRLSPGEARLRPPPDAARSRMLRSQSLAVPLVLSRACSLASFASAAPDPLETVYERSTPNAMSTVVLKSVISSFSTTALISTTWAPWMSRTVLPAS